MPLPALRNACTGYDRLVATNHATGPDRDLLMRLLDALVASQDGEEGSIETKHGRFTRGDLHEHGGILTSQNGRPVLIWPTSGQAGRWRYGEYPPS